MTANSVLPYNNRNVSYDKPELLSKLVIYSYLIYPVIIESQGFAA